MRILWIVVLALPTVAGFASVPTDSPHSRITETAADRVGWPEGGVDALVVAVHAPDYEQIDWEPRPDAPARYDVGEEYDPAHHCDRVPPTDDAAAFEATRAFIEERTAAVEAALKAEDLVDALGAALHALQDCFSHSDYVDLAPAEQERFVGFLFGHGSAPKVRVVATAPDINEPGMPDDSYPHDLYAKDSADMNDESQIEIGGRTKFEVARDAATNASARMIDLTLDRMSGAMREEIGGLGPEPPEGSPVPGMAPVVAVALLVVGLAAARRPPGG